MLNLRNFFIVILVSFLLFSFAFININSFASDINMNLGEEANVTDNDNPGNRNNENSRNELNNQNSTLNTNTQATVQSVDGFEDTTGGFDIANVLSILLLAVGLVIILLAVAILIRLGK